MPESQRLEGLAYWDVSVLSDSDKLLFLSHLILGYISDTLITAGCGLGNEVSRLLVECPLPFTRIRFLFDLLVLIARMSPMFALWFIKRYRDCCNPGSRGPNTHRQHRLRRLGSETLKCLGSLLFSSEVVLENSFRWLDLWWSNQCDQGPDSNERNTPSG